MIKLREVWEQVTKLPMPDDILSPEDFNLRLSLDKDHRNGILFGLGLKWNGEEFFYKDLNYHWTDILTANDEQFFKICKEIEWYFNSRCEVCGGTENLGNMTNGEIVQKICFNCISE